MSFTIKNNIPVPTQCSWVSDVLYHTGKKGEVRIWRTWSYKDKVYTVYGTEGGQLQLSQFQVEPKNISKANATTGEAQAIKEAQALEVKQLKRKYSTQRNRAKFSPMLAHEFKSQKLTLPAHCQTKLDGMRALTIKQNGVVKLISRGGLTYDVPHIQQELNQLLSEGQCLDGELYLHGEHLQDIISLVKRQQEGSENLEYWIYDAPNPGKTPNPWRERFKIIANLKLSSFPHIKLTPSYLIHSEDEIKTFHDKFVGEGYEGAIIRNLEGDYLFGYRSHDLQKYKNFLDSEFKITDVKEGKGKAAGTAIWVCQTPNGDEFDCAMRTSQKERQRLFKEAKQYIGQLLTVRYFAMTKDQKPQFPVGISIRPPEDLDE